MIYYDPLMIHNVSLMNYLGSHMIYYDLLLIHL